MWCLFVHMQMRHAAECVFNEATSRISTAVAASTSSSYVSIERPVRCNKCVRASRIGRSLLYLVFNYAMHVPTDSKIILCTRRPSVDKGEQHFPRVRICPMTKCSHSRIYTINTNLTMVI